MGRGETVDIARSLRLRKARIGGAPDDDISASSIGWPLKRLPRRYPGPSFFF